MFCSTATRQRIHVTNICGPTCDRLFDFTRQMITEGKLPNLIKFLTRYLFFISPWINKLTKIKPSRYRWTFLPFDIYRKIMENKCINFPHYTFLYNIFTTFLYKCQSNWCIAKNKNPICVVHTANRLGYWAVIRNFNPFCKWVLGPGW